MTTSKLSFLIGLTCLFLPIAYSADGAFEINQACVAQGCFEGDSSEFPIVIEAPGFYMLTSDLTTDDATKTLVEIRSQNVTLDLRGFTIGGPNNCTGEGIDCENESLAGHGVWSNQRNVVVRNGTVRGFGYGGVVLTGHVSRVERIRAEHNFRVGISLGSGGTVEDSQSNFNGYLGIQTGPARILRVTVMHNGQMGITTSQSLISEAVVTQNPGTGINDGWGSIIQNSIVSLNGQGIWLSSGGTRIMDTQITGNDGVGIFLQPALPPGLPSEEPLVSTFSGLSLYENNGGNDHPQMASSGGLWESLGENLCGRDKDCLN